MKQLTPILGGVGIVALLAAPATAQFVSLPVTGSFALTNTGAGNQYVNPGAPLTLLSPAGTINVTAVINQPIYQSTLTVTTNTPIGVYITGVSGSVALNDGRTAALTGNADAKLETLATVTGAPNFMSGGLIPNGATVSFAVVAGSLDIPQAALSAYPTPQVVVPVTGGSFTVTAPAGAGFETMTVNSLLSPLGTTNLTLTFPLLTDPGNTTFPYVISTAVIPVVIGGLVNGTIALNDGRSLTASDRLVRLEGTAQVTSAAPVTTYQFPAVYNTPITLTGQFTGGNISLLVPTVTLPPSSIPTPPEVLLNPPPPVLATAVSPPRLTPITANDFSQVVNIAGEVTDVPGLNLAVQSGDSSPENVAELADSPLAYSRIHPCVSALSAQGFRCQ